MSVSKNVKMAGFGIALGLTIVSGGAQASTHVVSLGEQINQSHKDMALLQSMKRDACFKMAGIEGMDFSARMNTAIETFERSVDRLRTDQALAGPARLSAETLTEPKGEWNTLSAALRQVAAGDFHYVAVRQVLTLEEKIAKELATIRMGIDTNSADLTADEKRTAAILEQKTRVQQLTKEACLVLRDISREENLAKLLTTMEAFETAKEFAIASATTDQEKQNLKALASAWDEFGTLLGYLKTKADVEDTAKTQLSDLSDALTAHLAALITTSPEQADTSADFLKFYDQQTLSN